MEFNTAYQRNSLLSFLKEEFLVDFKQDIKPVELAESSSIKNAHYLGESKNLDLQVFEFLFEGSPNKRVALTKDAFSVMRSSGIFNALAVFNSPNNNDWRFSLMTATPEPTEKGKVSLSYSNPKRLSFFLGPNAKINTPTRFLKGKGKVVDFEDLKNRFSIEVVNKEFYKEISQAFTKLVSGLLKLPSTGDKSQTNLEFAVRLIGRIIFCWFLREKKSNAGLSLMPKELLSFDAVKDNEDYYHKVLEPIFFEVLNKQLTSRREEFAKEPFSSIPYLNGGLFSPQKSDDFYERSREDLQSRYHNTVVIPDSWLADFFEILETYNFTIDENTSYDEELSIDPEMLGRIFENLLAEINPETGESARKSTGSYYTPRAIVNYMVDESLLLYLKDKTEMGEEKLRAIISYDLTDDSKNPINSEEKEKIIEALERVKILDPACGSGAFPIGALQKIVFILQQTDPDGKLWKNQQLSNADPEFRRDIEKRFSKNQIDFLRKSLIIRKSIFGVDLQPIATEISRLRCFLTLIVDEFVDDSADNRGIKPLPNLDFKFVTANSLIGLPVSVQSSLFEDKYGIEQLKELRNHYFGATNEERLELKDQFKEVQKEMLSRMIDLKGDDDLTRKLSEWNPFSHKLTSWFDPEWMFGVKDGFDIVIANPPYGANIDNLVTYFRNTYLDVVRNYTDIFKIFFSFGIRVLNKSGVLIYITPNVFLTQPRYKDLRLYLLKYTIRKILNLGQEVFEGAVVPTCITLLKNTESSDDYTLYDASVNSKYKGDLNNMITYQVSVKQVREMPDLSFYQTSKYKTDEIILDKVMEIKDAGIQYHRSGIGLKNKGGNDLFERLVNSDKKFYPNSIPVWYGKLINRYYISPSSNEYFNLDYKEILKKDESVSFSKDAFAVNEKIIWRQTASYIIATIDKNCRWFRNTVQCGWIKPQFKGNLKIEYLLAVLNSKYIKFLYQKIVNESSGRTFPQVKITHVKKLPIKICDMTIQKDFVDIVLKIMNITGSSKYIDDSEKQTQVKQYEDEIDQMVYKLYGLTEEEKEIVEKS